MKANRDTEERRYVSPVKEKQPMERLQLNGPLSETEEHTKFNRGEG